MSDAKEIALADLIDENKGLIAAIDKLKKQNEYKIYQQISNKIKFLLATFFYSEDAEEYIKICLRENKKCYFYLEDGKTAKQYRWGDE